jgi:hypothetical protein
MDNQISLMSSEAYKIFKKFGVRYGSIWAKTDRQDKIIDLILAALRDAGFKDSKSGPWGSSTYISYLAKGSELVYYNARTGSPGLQAISLINPPPPERPQYPKKIKKENKMKLTPNQKQLVKEYVNSLKELDLPSTNTHPWVMKSMQELKEDLIYYTGTKPNLKIDFQLLKSKLNNLVKLINKYHK